jgi:hypothetical protein
MKEGLKPISYDLAERYEQKVSMDALLSYQSNRYCVPYLYEGQVVEIQDHPIGTLTPSFSFGRLWTREGIISPHASPTTFILFG